MADSPTLYVMHTPEHDGATGFVREASRSEILSAARTHLDYEAAESLFDDGADLDWLADKRLAVDVLVRKIVDAALGLTEEGTQQ